MERILVVDLDVHQGNGTAHIFAGNASVTTLSVHCEGNLFSKRETSDIDVDVPLRCGDDEYLKLLEECLPAAFERVRPTLCFFQAGVDPHSSDRFGKLEVSSAGLKRRNALVYRLAALHRSRLVVPRASF